VTLFRGSSDGLATVSSRTITGETNGNYFGAYLHCSDLNGDGYADLYVQDDGYDWDGSSGPYLGKVYWFRGRATGIGSDPDWSLTLYLSED
jgi:hypothetical protein